MLSSYILSQSEANEYMSVRATLHHIKGNSSVFKVGECYL